MDQASDRIMYMANSEGLLSYNGNSWTLHKTPNQKIIRSIKVVHDRIYTGSYGEIGYWTSGDCNELNYQSLTNLVPENAISKEEIWHILHVKDKIYFQSFSVFSASPRDPLHFFVSCALVSWCLSGERILTS